ncbi:MAG: BACON domain-containing protein [Muribaculaceae bacterium]|nr:BACON domain-containing protein [Muribaculaceae bacterium]
MNTKILSAILMAVTAMTGCSSLDMPADPGIGGITADITSISVPAEGASYTVNLGVPGQGKEWKSIIPSDNWLTLTPDNGYDKSGHYRLTVTAAPHSGTDLRRGEICIYTDNDHINITVTQTPQVREGCCALSQKELNFAATQCDYRSVTISPYEDLEISAAGTDWLQIAGMPTATTVKAGKELTLTLAPDGPYTSKRSAAITFTGKSSGTQSTLLISHEAIENGNALPSRWYYTNSEASSCGWLTSASAGANYDTGKQRSYLTAVGVNNRKLNHTISTAYKSSIAVSGLYTGDYLLWSVPSDNLPAGSAVDFMLTISSADNNAPKYWICEILDGDQWRMPKESDLRTTPDGDKYSFYTKYYSSYQHASFAQSFTLENPVTDGIVRIRCRVVGSRNGSEGTLQPDNSGEIYLPSHEFHFSTITAYPGTALKDTKKVAILGNSFTHYFASAFLLKELARSQGYELDIRVHAKGSQYFSNHLDLERSRDVWGESGYDFVIMQEQSTRYSDYAKNPQKAILDDCKALSAKFRNGSPAAKIILENTWAFPKTNWNNYGSSAAFQAQLLEGTKAVAGADDNVDWVSPIGVAFDKANAAGITDLFYTDSKHPNRNGAYLKSCVNYLVIFGERFDSNASDGGCDPTVAAQLRSIAEETVLGHESEYFINR